MFQIAVAMIYYDTNRELQFEKARSALISSSLRNLKKPSEANERKLLQDANTAFEERSTTYCDLFILVKHKRQVKTSRKI